MSAQHQYDQYGRGYRQASQETYSYDVASTRSSQASDSYNNDDTHTQYGPYDPRYPYGPPSDSQHQKGQGAAQPQAVHSTAPSYSSVQQRSASTTSYHSTAQTTTDHLSRMQVRDDASYTASARPQHHAQTQSQQYSQQAAQVLPDQDYRQTSFLPPYGSTSRQQSISHNASSLSHFGSAQRTDQGKTNAAQIPPSLGMTGTQQYQATGREHSDRPVSSSASGIISLYTYDGSTPILDQNANFASFPHDPAASTTAHSAGAARSDLTASDRNRLAYQPSQRSSRPLPLTPTAKHPEQLPPLSPGGYGGVVVRASDATSAGPVSPASRIEDSDSYAQRGYFTTASPQPTTWSPPVTPLATQHRAAPSSSSASYGAPRSSPSPSNQETPSSSYGHRPLPSTATSVDRSFSPPPREGASASPLSAFRSPSYTQPSKRPTWSPAQSREQNQRSDASLGPVYRAASASQSHTADSSYDPDSYESANIDRQRTRSEASDLSLGLSRSARQPLPPIPGAITSMQQSDSLGHGYPTRSSASGQYASDDANRERMASTGSIQRQTSYSQIPPANVQAFETQRGVTVLGDEKRDLAQKYGHERFDSLAWEPVNTPRPNAAQSLAQGARSSRVEAPEWSLLSTVALLLRANIPRGVQIKGSIDYPNSFTGKDVVSTLQELLVTETVGSQHTLVKSGDPNSIRQVALSLAKSLKSQLFFHEVDWGEKELTDDVDEVYTFLEDSLADISSTPEDPDDWAAALNHNAAFDSNLQLSVGGAGNVNGNGSGQRRKPAQATDLDDLPNGVFTPLTRCYSPLCSPGRPSACYSPSCPNSAYSPLPLTVCDNENSAGRVGGMLDKSLTADTSQKKAWAEIVPPELLKNIPHDEIARQNAILETIQKEEEFLADLELLDTLFVQGLQRPSDAGDPPPLPIGPERDDFIREVFGNHLELAAHIRALVERLHIRQREENPIVQTIGDIFLSAALDWGDAYTTYVVNYPLAISRVKREMTINPRFKAFVEACRRHPAAHKHPLENFLFRPPARLQRYHLHLESILKKTEKDNHDRDSLQNAIDIINDQCKTAQAGVESAELKVKIREYAYNLSAKRNKHAIDMDLLNPERQLIHQGKVLRKPDAFDFDWTELQAILFDNYFIVTKPKRIEGAEDDGANVATSSSFLGARFVLAKRPIPVEMLEVTGLTESSISRSIGLSNFHISREREARDFWPFTISHLGGKVEPIALYAPSKAARDQWKVKLDEAIGFRMAVQDNNKVFEQHILSDDIFAIPPTLSLEPDKPVPGVDPSVFHGRVTCAVPFVTADGRRLVAVGCADGVWIGLRNDPKSLRKVLHLKYVTQCAVLESFGIFVVLADKVLISYSLEALVPTTSSSASALRPPQKLSGNRDVLFFNVGVLKDRTLLIYMKKKANESVFRALEPVLNAPRGTEGKSGSGFFGKFGKDSKNSDWFRIYKTFFIPSEAYSIQFLKSKLCIICAKGFEIMNLDSLLPGTIPDFVHANREDIRVQQLQKRVETDKPLGMYKTSDGDFLLCYDAFACYVDRLGEPTRLEQIIEWEGFPKQVAFSGNYVLAFDSRFVEVRDALTGRLVQIMRGSDLTYVSGNSTVTSSSSESAQLAALDAEANPVILTKRERVVGRIPFDFQKVVELTPTAPLNAYAPPFQRSATILSTGSSLSGRPSGRPSVASSGNWI